MKGSDSPPMEGEGKADDDIVLIILTDAEEGEERKREKNRSCIHARCKIWQIHTIYRAG